MLCEWFLAVHALLRTRFPSDTQAEAVLAAQVDPFLTEREKGCSGEDRVTQSLWLRVWAFQLPGMVVGLCYGSLWAEN